MADEALDLIMNFAGLAVISELDDWVGEQIMGESLTLQGIDLDKPEEEFEDEEQKEIAKQFKNCSFTKFTWHRNIFFNRQHYTNMIVL